MEEEEAREGPETGRSSRADALREEAARNEDDEPDERDGAASPLSRDDGSGPSRDGEAGASREAADVT